MILELFAAKPDHPLADAKELKRVIAALPLYNAFKSVDEILGWLESLSRVSGFRVDRLFEVIRTLDDAAQQHVRRINREYLQSPRLSRSEEKRFSAISQNFWRQLGDVYSLCVDRVVAALGRRDHRSPEEKQDAKGAEVLRPLLPLLAARALEALAQQLKWAHFHYGPYPAEFWGQLGALYLKVEQLGVAHKPVQLYPGNGAQVTPGQVFLRTLVLHASSPDALTPLEVDLADRLTLYFVPGFVFTPESRADNVYWADLAKPLPPARLAVDPLLTPTLRFFAPGAAHGALALLLSRVERGQVPDNLPLGGEFSPATLLPVLRHLYLYWAPVPPQRQSPRHPVHSRVHVRHGFEGAVDTFSGNGGGDQEETWVVENISRGGFGARIPQIQGDWLRIGTLLVLQPEGSSHWLLGVLRRYALDSERQAVVGVQTLARQAVSAILRPMVGGVDNLGGISALWLEADSEAPTRHDQWLDEVRLVLPANTFDPREKLETTVNGRTVVLSPVERLEGGPDFEVGRYRLRYTS